MSVISITFIFYLIVILTIGFLSVRKTKNMNDFALGGQRLGPWVIAFSERASGESAWLIIGLPGAALVAGLLELWTVIGCVTGIIVSWIIIAKPLRLATEKYNAITLPELLSKKFDDENGLIRYISSLIIVFFFTFYIAAQFSGAGKVLNVTFGLSHFNGMLMGAVIIIFYTMLGGFLAVAWTDLIQGIIMIGTLVILPIVAYVELSTVEVHERIFDFGTLWGGKSGLEALIGTVGGLSWGLGYMGQPHLVTRFMAIDDPENIKTSRKIAATWALPAFVGSLMIGLIGKQLISSGLLYSNGSLITEISDPEKLMPMMASHLLNPWIAGIFISGAIAAMMSTADSQLLVSTTVITKDILSKRHRLAEKINLLVVSRIITLAIGVLGFFLAWNSTDLVFELVSYAWSGLGASFGPALILSLWWKRTTRNGIVAGLLTGAIVTIFWVNVGNLRVFMTERLISFVFAFIVIILVSILDGKSQKIA